MLQPDFDPAPTTRPHLPFVATLRRAERADCSKRATLIAEKVDGAGRHVRQIELSARHREIVIERERGRGLEICDRRAKSVRVDSSRGSCRIVRGGHAIASGAM